MTERGRCSICERDRAPNCELCDIHELARRNLEQRFEVWRDAYSGQLSWSDFLERVIENDATGEAVVEVASQWLSKTHGEESK
jgi:hypothetical protein